MLLVGAKIALKSDILQYIRLFFILADENSVLFRNSGLLQLK